MPEVHDAPDLDRVAAEIEALTNALDSQLPDSPMSRWFEYRAYQELVALSVHANALPRSYVLVALDAASLREWIIAGKHLAKGFFRREIERLLHALQDASGDVFDRLCRLYCKLKKAGGITVGAVNLLLQVKGVSAAIVAAGGGFLFIGGLPLTAILAYLLAHGLLDKVCKCP
jgi:hypothetical protein